MKLEDQVATMEQCEKINDLMDGSEDIITVFYWRYPSNKWIVEPLGYFNPHEDGVECFPAYTVSELTEMLPNFYPSWRFPVAGKADMWIATVICSPQPEGIDNIHTASEFDRHGNTQAEALANILISLLETETITPEEVNNRIKGIK